MINLPKDFHIFMLKLNNFNTSLIILNLQFNIHNFFIEGIYKGIHNKERLAGSKACKKSLHDKSNTGIISTHHLELTGLESELSTIKIFHLHGHIENGKIIIKSKLRKGLYYATNTLITMKNEGLPT